MFRFTSMSTKIALLSLLLLVTTSVGVGYVIYAPHNDILVRKELASLDAEAESRRYRIVKVIETLGRDVAFLANTPPVRGIVRARAAGGVDPLDGSPESVWTARLESTFSEFLRAKPGYLQARFIGHRNYGRELVRVERELLQGQIVVVGEQSLQQKGRTGYFTEAFALAPGQIYLSEVDLNREHNTVTEPHLPVLRAATPVFDDRGVAFGIVVINMDFRGVLDGLRLGLPEGYALYLTNQRGDYLFHSERPVAFGFDLGKRFRLQDDIPQIAAEFSGDTGNEKVSVTLANKAGSLSGAIRELRMVKARFDPRRPDRFLAIALSAGHDLVLAQTRRVRNDTVLTATVLIATGIALAFLFTRRLTRPLSQMSTSADQIAEGNYDVSFPTDSSDECGVLGRSFKAMVQRIEERGRLVAAQHELKNRLGTLAEHIRGDPPLPDLGRKALQYLADCVGAQVGAMYTEEGGVLKLLATCAYSRRKNLDPEFRLGEGLVGQAALEKKPAEITNVPEDYVTVRSALGERPPRSILVYPLMRDGTLKGIIELGTLGVFREQDRAFLEQAAEHLAVAIDSAQSRLRTKELLEESRRQAEELQYQQEELRATNEQLEEQANRLKESEEKLHSQSEELRETNSALEDKTRFLERQKDALEDSRAELEEQAERLASSSQYKSEFLANMSHELRTPLNSLLILSKTLADNVDGNLNEDQIKCLGIIHDSGQDLLALISDILDLSKIEAGQMSAQDDEVHIDALCESLRDQFLPLAQEKGIGLHVEYGARLAPLQSDQLRLAQILKNLLSNAIKFTDSGSVRLDVEQRDRNLVFRVSDTGPGIAPSKQQAVFEAFQQGDGSTCRRYGGTGLGLTISQELAHLLGGEIELQSREGEGSQFRLLVPLRAADVPDSIKESPAPEDPPVFVDDDRASLESDDRIVLIIEDDEGFARMVMKLAREQGFRCLVAGTGRSGVALASKFRPAGIILDPGLPDVDETTVLDRLKTNALTESIPVFVVSGRTEKDPLLEKGAIGFLPKPVSDADLIAALRQFTRFRDGTAKRLLMVDHDERRADVVKGLFERASFETRFATTGGQAVTMLSERRFDCMVLDLNLPDGGGLALLQELAQRQLMPDRVIVYTTRELEEDEHEEIRRYADRVIPGCGDSSERLLDEISLFFHSVRPAPDEAKRGHPARYGAGDPLRGRKVLLVDDDLRNAFALTKVLRQHDMTVEIADNGELALEKLDSQHDIDLVVTDIMMPVLDGYETMRRIRRRPEWSQLPVIALTAKSMKEDRALCIDAGASDYLTKPVDVERLLALMRIWLSGEAVPDGVAAAVAGGTTSPEPPASHRVAKGSAS